MTASELVFYQGEDGVGRVQVRLDQGSVWLTQRLLADLYQVTVPTVNEHLANIYDEGEADPGATIRKFRIVQTEGNREVSRLVDHYELEVILAVGYRVRSHSGTQFRRWATARLQEYLTKGFVLDDERLKEGRSLGADYFDELLGRIREIRASEKRFYQKIRDLYALAVDYDAQTDETRAFFQTVENKTKRLVDVEVTQLNRIVTMYLDYAEEQAERRQPMTMRDWREKLDGFLQFNERAVLQDAGRISSEVAQKLAVGEYEKFERRRLTDEAAEADAFDAATKKLSPAKPRKRNT